MSKRKHVHNAPKCSMHNLFHSILSKTEMEVTMTISQKAFAIGTFRASEK